MGKIISLSGKKQSGKSSIAKYLIDKHGFVEVSWAEPLKEIIGKQLLGLSREQLHGSQESRETVDPRWGMSPRQLLQKIGTELFRERLMDDFWVRIGMDRIKALLVEGKSVVVPDTRFPNELKAIEDLGGITIIMRRPDSPYQDTHTSEIALDDTSFEFEVSAMTGQLHHVYPWVDSLVSEVSCVVPTTK